MSEYMADISSLLASTGINNGTTAINSTSRKNNIDLDMTDFLKLMVTQLQSQTLDNTMDTSEMMNQMVQMQMITAITNMTETSVMTYASSLVNKEVTIGIVNGDQLEERVVNIIGTGMSDGQQVVFGDDGETYALSQIMAVGRLPDIEGVTKPEESTTDPAAPTQPTGPSDPSDTDKPVEGPGSSTGNNTGSTGSEDSTADPTEPAG